MKKNLFFAVSLVVYVSAHAQVTQINANKSLHGVIPLNSTLAIFESGVDSSIWVSDGTKANTIQISDTIKYIGGGALLNGKYIFKGKSPKCGKEIFITDGTKAGTTIIKDINPGIANSQPNATTMEMVNGYVYFAAVTTTQGCELWRTDGTPGNTTIVKDIGSLATSGIDSVHFSLGLVGNNILFTATTPENGNELWKTDGTTANTLELKDIVPSLSSSNPRFFYPFNNMALFMVNSADGNKGEIWRTDGTPGGTILIKNNIIPSFSLSSTVIIFHVFKGRAYFMIKDGVHSGDALYNTDAIDASTTHTTFLKDMGSSTFTGGALLADAFNLPNKFIFPYTNDGVSVFDLYQCDGTGAGTVVFKSFPPNTNSNIPIIYTNISFDKLSQTITYPLFKGKFYFSADDVTHGNELWMSDGSTATMLSDINSHGDGINDNLSFLFTSSTLFFAADDGTHGNELWKTDGTAVGTMMVQDIFPGSHNADPSLEFINNGKIFFTATDSDPADSSVTDLYVVDGIFSPLPVNLLDFTVSPKGADALLKWSTSQEINSRNFTIQSSNDAQHWNDIGTVSAMGNSSTQTNYSFIDAGVMNSGKSIVYYRLAETDIDGKMTYSNIVQLKINNTDKWNVQLYSNPIHDKVKLMLTGIQGSAVISINNINGQSLYETQIQNQNGFMTLPVNLRGGIYLLVVRTNNEVKTIKFVKE